MTKFSTPWEEYGSPRYDLYKFRSIIHLMWKLSTNFSLVLRLICFSGMFPLGNVLTFRKVNRVCQ